MHVRLPSGGVGKRCSYIYLGRMLKEKCGIIRIKTDNLCCARALVTALAQIDKHPQWENIRRGRRIQTNLLSTCTKLQVYLNVNAP